MCRLPSTQNRQSGVFLVEGGQAPRRASCAAPPAEPLIYNGSASVSKAHVRSDSSYCLWNRETSVFCPLLNLPISRSFRVLLAPSEMSVWCFSFLPDRRVGVSTRGNLFLNLIFGLLLVSPAVDWFPHFADFWNTNSGLQSCRISVINTIRLIKLVKLSETTVTTVNRTK